MVERFKRGEEIMVLSFEQKEYLKDNLELRKENNDYWDVDGNLVSCTTLQLVFEGVVISEVDFDA